MMTESSGVDFALFRKRLQSSEIQSAEHEIELAYEFPPAVLGYLTLISRRLSDAQRLALTADMTPEWRGYVACYCDWVPFDARLRLIEGLPESLREGVIRDAARTRETGLSGEQRAQLAMLGNPDTRIFVAVHAFGLSDEERGRLGLHLF